MSARARQRAIKEEGGAREWPHEEHNGSSGLRKVARDVHQVIGRRVLKGSGRDDPTCACIFDVPVKDRGKRVRVGVVVGGQPAPAY